MRETRQQRPFQASPLPPSRQTLHHRWPPPPPSSLSLLSHRLELSAGCQMQWAVGRRREGLRSRGLGLCLLGPGCPPDSAAGRHGRDPAHACVPSAGQYSAELSARHIKFVCYGVARMSRSCAHQQAVYLIGTWLTPAACGGVWVGWTVLPLLIGGNGYDCGPLPSQDSG